MTLQDLELSTRQTADAADCADPACAPTATRPGGHALLGPDSAATYAEWFATLSDADPGAPAARGGDRAAWLDQGG